MDALLKGGYLHVVEVDIKGYFDAIPRERLMERVKEHVADGRVLALIEGSPQQGVMEDREVTETETGTPQGGVISPLLANIYLNPLDWLMTQMGAGDGPICRRYADDMVVLCRTPETAAQALSLIQQWMTAAGLQLYPVKTRVTTMIETRSHFYLGFAFKGKSDRLLGQIGPRTLPRRQ